MTTNKDSKYVVMCLIAVPVLITCSLLVEYNEVDALFLLFIISAIIRYIIIVRKG